MIELTEGEELAAYLSAYLPSAGAHAGDKARYAVYALYASPSIEALDASVRTLFGADYMWHVTVAYKILYVAIGVPDDEERRVGLLIDFNEIVRHIYSVGGSTAALNAAVSQRESLPFLEDHGMLTLHGACRWLNLSEVLWAYLKALPDPVIVHAATPRVLQYAAHATHYDDIFVPSATYLAPRPVRFMSGSIQSWCTTFATPFAAAVRASGNADVPTVTAEEVEAAPGHGQALCARKVLNNLFRIVPWDRRFQMLTSIFRQEAQRRGADTTQFEEAVRAFE